MHMSYKLTLSIDKERLQSSKDGFFSTFCFVWTRLSGSGGVTSILTPSDTATSDVYPTLSMA